MQLEAARLMVYQAARMYDAGYDAGEYANAAKYLAAEAAFTACESGDDAWWGGICQRVSR